MDRGRWVLGFGAGLGLLAALALMGCASTRPAGLGVQAGALSPCPDKPNCVSSTATDPVHSIDPFFVRPPASDAWEALAALLESTPGVEIVHERKTGRRYLHAEYTSSLMRYVDDVEFVGSADGRRIDLRSASRVGYGDMGVNRERVESIRKSLAEDGLIER